MPVAPIDDNSRQGLIAVSSTDGTSIVRLYADPITHRLLVDVSATPTPIAIGDTVTGGTTGSVLFVGAGPVLAQDNTNLFFDNTNNRLGVQNNAPTAPLSVGSGATAITSGNTVGSFVSTVAGYNELNHQNLSNGTTSSTDVTLSNDIGTAGTNYLDLGLNSSTNTDPLYTAFGAGAGYLYNYSGQLSVGTAGAFPVTFFTGGTLAANERMRITSAGLVGIATTSPDRLLHEEVSDAGTNAVVYGQRHSHITSGTATTGFGIGEEYELENASGTNRVVGTSEFAYTDAVNATEDANWKLRLIRAGTLTDAVTVDSLGVMTATGFNGTVGATTPSTGVFTTLVANATTSLLLGTAGSAVGNIGFRNATSGTITLAPVTGALGTVTLSLPAATDTLVGRATTDTLTNKIVSHTVEPGTDDTFTGEQITGFNATATIAQWEAVYLSTTGWALTDADAAATAGGVCVGLAAAAGTNGNPLTVVMRGVIRNDGWTWTTVGAPLYLSTTAGALTETAPSGTDDVVRIIGYVMSDDCIYLNPSNDWITIV